MSERRKRWVAFFNHMYSNQLVMLAAILWGAIFKNANDWIVWTIGFVTILGLCAAVTAWQQRPTWRAHVRWAWSQPRAPKDHEVLVTIRIREKRETGPASIYTSPKKDNS